MSSQKRIDCFGSGGNTFGNNTKCPDSDACCNTAKQCRPDRLCVSDNDPDTLVRAPCSIFPWNANCPRICIEEDSSGFLPRVNICPDGSYCCVKDPTCCADKSGFFLNDDGTIKARANETRPEPTTSSKTTIAPSSSVSNEAPTDGSITGPPAATSSADNPQPASPGLSQPAKFGVGFGVAFGVALLLLIAFFAWRKRQQKNRLQMNPAAYPTYGQTNKTGEIPVELPTPNNPPLSELEGYYSQGSRR